jgi:hypothetical protein
MNHLKWLSPALISLMLMSCGSGSSTTTAAATSTSSQETFGQSSFGTAKFN